MANNLKLALGEAMEAEFAWLDDFVNPYEDHEFSPEFEANMKTIIRKSNYSYVSIGRKRIRKTMVIALVSLFILALSGCAFAAVHYLIQWNETQNHTTGTVDINFQTDSDAIRNLDDADRDVIPTTPAGFKITSDETDGDAYRTREYSNADHQWIVYNRTGSVENMGMSLNNEDNDLAEVNVNGYKGYSAYEDGANYLIWTDGVNLYELYGNCDMDIILEMSKDIKIE